MANLTSFSPRPDLTEQDLTGRPNYTAAALASEAGRPIRFAAQEKKRLEIAARNAAARIASGP